MTQAVSLSPASRRARRPRSSVAPAIAASVLARLGAVRLRPTPARIHILVALDNASAPMTAEDLLGLLTISGTPVGMGSVYRVLTALTSVGLLQRVWVRGQSGAKSAYSIVTAQNEPSVSTHRLTCEHCGRCHSFVDAGLTERLRVAAGLPGLRIPPQGLSITVSCMGNDAGCLHGLPQAH